MPSLKWARERARRRCRRRWPEAVFDQRDTRDRGEVEQLLRPRLHPPSAEKREDDRSGRHPEDAEGGRVFKGLGASEL